MRDRTGGRVSGTMRLRDLEVYGLDGQPELIRPPSDGVPAIETISPP